MIGEQLVVLLEGREAGRLNRSKGRLSFIYDEAWRARRNAYPLSLSMPLAAPDHGHPPMEAFLWGLLPDNQAVIDRWSRLFQVSPRNPFALIAAVGEDCAGAVQFIRPERLAALQAGTDDDVRWLEERDVAARLRALRRDHAAWRDAGDTGQFSLAGVQPKTALLLQDGRWGVPTGRVATTHILKPPTGQWDGHAENEHFCLRLARRLGLPAARSEVRRFEDEIAIVVERYDRVWVGDRLVRVHQEDACQALAHPPWAKYENEGGPGVRQLHSLLVAQSSAPVEDAAAFIDAVLLNWIIAGPDAHAKNDSLLLAGGGRVRLAPLYDVASALPYPDLDIQKVRLAMKFGGEYRLRDIGPKHLLRLASDVRTRPEALRARAQNLIERIPDLAATVAHDVSAEGLDHALLPHLASSIRARARSLGRQMETAAPFTP